MQIKGNQSAAIQSAHGMSDYMDLALRICLLDGISEDARPSIGGPYWWNLRKQCRVRADLLKVRLKSTKIVYSKKLLRDQKATCKYEILHARFPARLSKWTSYNHRARL